MKQTEAQFLAAVIQYAELKGWMVYHTHDSRRSQPGFPDLTMVRYGMLVFAELKSERGRFTREQIIWIDALDQVSEHDTFVSVHCWRPKDWPAIERILG